MVSNLEWKRWGAADPLWAVAAWAGKQRNGPEPWNETDFYALGYSDWLDFRRRWERYGVDRTSCAEIGCGAGRITAQLVQYFGTVHGLDVSEGMLDFARCRIADARFYLTDGMRIPLDDVSITAVFSSHVLQHLDSPEDSIPMFAEIYRVLVPNCTMMIHLPIYNWPSGRGLFERLFVARQWLARQKARVDRARGRPMMRGTFYEAGWLAEILKKRGFVNVEFLSFPVSSNGGLHSFVLARKPAGDGSQA